MMRCINELTRGYCSMQQNMINEDAEIATRMLRQQRCVIEIKTSLNALDESLRHFVQTWSRNARSPGMLLKPGAG